MTWSSRFARSQRGTIVSGSRAGSRQRRCADRAQGESQVNRQGTLELRGMDSNYPEVTLATAARPVPRWRGRGLRSAKGARRSRA